MSITAKPKHTDSTPEVLVKVEHVSKKFCRSLKRSLWYGVRDMASELSPVSRSNRDAENNMLAAPTDAELRKDEFWAVHDISFELRRGECLGLIGHNGAGKSTLLKLLNGVIKPDHGRIEICGRVSALIELSAGFNPILSGRENIYGKGAVLGISKQEMDRKFDAIAEFAEIGDFLDMPVQNYSSGMQVRLGFAVAAQMDPDVLIIDEVLAVGDLGFVVKCLNRMAEIIPNSAVIFVSHTMPMVARICTHGLLMDRGREEYLGPDVAHAIESYIHRFQTGGRREQGSGAIVVHRVGLRSNESEPFDFDDAFIHENGAPLQARLELEIVSDEPAAFDLFLIILDQQLREIVNSLSKENSDPIQRAAAGPFTVDVQLPQLYLNRGKHTITVGASNRETGEIFCRTTNVTTFMVRSRIQSWGTCLVPGQWHLSGGVQ